MVCRKRQFYCCSEKSSLGRYAISEHSSKWVEMAFPGTCKRRMFLVRRKMQWRAVDRNGAAGRRTDT